MAGVLNCFSFATVTTIVRLKSSCYNENAVKITAFLVVGLEKVVFREGNCQGDRKLRAGPA